MDALSFQTVPDFSTFMSPGMINSLYFPNWGTIIFLCAPSLYMPPNPLPSQLLLLLANFFAVLPTQNRELQLSLHFLLLSAQQLSPSLSFLFFFFFSGPQVRTKNQRGEKINSL